MIRGTGVAKCFWQRLGQTAELSVLNFHRSDVLRKVCFWTPEFATWDHCPIPQKVQMHFQDSWMELDSLRVAAHALELVLFSVPHKLYLSFTFTLARLCEAAAHLA